MATQKQNTRKAQTKAAEPNAGDGAQAPEASQAKVEAEQAITQEPAAKGDGAKVSAKAPKDSRTPGEIPGVFVRAKKRFGSRRRAGFRITREGHGIALSALTNEQLEQLHADPALEVESCTFPAESDAEAEA